MLIGNFARACSLEITPDNFDIVESARVRLIFDTSKQILLYIDDVDFSGILRSSRHGKCIVSAARTEVRDAHPRLYAKLPDILMRQRKCVSGLCCLFSNHLVQYKPCALARMTEKKPVGKLLERRIIGFKHNE